MLKLAKVVLVKPSIVEYCMLVNMDAQSDELALNVEKWVSVSSLSTKKLNGESL